MIRTGIIEGDDNVVAGWQANVLLAQEVTIGR